MQFESSSVCRTPAPQLFRLAAGLHRSPRSCRCGRPCWATLESGLTDGSFPDGFSPSLTHGWGMRFTWPWRSSRPTLHMRKPGTSSHLVVLPDVSLTRFPTLTEERALGGQRNVLRRAWSRWEILGELLMRGFPLLGEDELVGLLERTAVARNRSLVKALAERVLNYQGARARSEYARDLYKRVRYRTGPLMLDLYSSADLDDLITLESDACA